MWETIQTYVIWTLIVLIGIIIPAATFLYVLIAYGKRFLWPMGRFKRQTFIEGLVAWFLLNTFIVMIIIGSMMYSVTFFTKTLESPGFNIFTQFYLGLFYLEWVFALATLLPVCAKRWHDLGLSGWLCLLNTAPVLVVGAGFIGFFNNVGNVLFYHLFTDDKALGPGINAFTVLAQAQGQYLKYFVNPSPLLTFLTLAVMLGAFLYPALAKGEPGGNAHGKVAV
ncbi:MAG TPA: DUF805 domain-containing protein [Opitutales bacterium]|nr:DUF805 domain-containing protein [Opitutales bacterium]